MGNKLCCARRYWLPIAPDWIIATLHLDNTAVRQGDI